MIARMRTDVMSVVLQPFLGNTKTIVLVDKLSFKTKQNNTSLTIIFNKYLTPDLLVNLFT